MQDSDRRDQLRRFGLFLLGIVLLLAALTVGYVRFYDRFLRDPDVPPSAKGLNPRVVTFEVTLWVVVVIVLGFMILRLLRRRR